MHTLVRLRIDSTPLEGIDIGRENDEFKDELDDGKCDVILAIGYSHADDCNLAIREVFLPVKSVGVTGDGRRMGYDITGKPPGTGE